MTQNTTVVPFVRSKTVSIELPRNLGTLNIRPLQSNYMMITSPGLLINDRVYSFSGGVVVHTNNRWYFKDKVEIGVIGGRPSPKAAEEALAVIVGALNASIENDPEFQGRIVELREQEQIRAAELERQQRLHQYKILRQAVNSCRREQEYRQERLQLSLRDYEQAQVKLVEFMGQHPEIVEEADQEGSAY